MKKLIPLFFLTAIIAIPISGFSQNRKITGTVMAFRKFPLNDITVKAKKAKTEAKTDKTGKFEIEVRKKDVLVIQEPDFMDYSARVSPSENSVDINLIIKNDEKSQQNVIDKGYISRENLEYGTRNLWQTNNEYTKFTDAYDAIKYAIPEAMIVVENGRRGVQLRGPKTIYGSNLALLVVNGVIVDDVSFILPSDIISISKLTTGKSALYGSRAGNGVINIQTR